MKPYGAIILIRLGLISLISFHGWLIKVSHFIGSKGYFLCRLLTHQILVEMYIPAIGTYIFNKIQWVRNLRKI